MPTYEYACKKCGDTFDVVQSFADEPLKRHKGGCGGAVRRVFGSVGISFKGSGFYKNDSRSSSSGASKEKADKAETKAETSTDTKSESKSDTKSQSESQSKSEKKSEAKSDKKPAKAS